MTEQTAVGVLLLLSFIAANLPWLSDRLFFILRPATGNKRTVYRLLEWLFMYITAGGIALGLEHKLTGNTHAQEWEFYAVTGCLFIIFALPGFIYHVELKSQLARARRRRTGA